MSSHNSLTSSGTARAAERHYSVKEIAELWGYSRTTIIRELQGEEGVIAVGEKKLRRSIPESVAVRVHERLENNRLQAATPRRNPLRVILLRDLDGRMSQKARNIIKRKATQQ